MGKSGGGRMRVWYPRLIDQESGEGSTSVGPFPRVALPRYAMTKVKSQSRQTTRKRRIGEAAARRAEKVRQEIKDMIVASSLDMTKSVVRSVKRRGSAASMRFLWSIAGMQEPGAAKVVPTPSSLQTLMDKLELYEKPTVPAVDGLGGEVKSQEQS